MLVERATHSQRVKQMCKFNEPTFVDWIEGEMHLAHAVEYVSPGVSLGLVADLRSFCDDALRGRAILLRGISPQCGLEMKPNEPRALDCMTTSQSELHVLLTASSVSS